MVDPITEGNLHPCLARQWGILEKTDQDVSKDTDAGTWLERKPQPESAEGRMAGALAHSGLPSMEGVSPGAIL